MQGRSPRYQVTVTTPDGETTEWFDAADDAMKAVNRLAALRIAGYVIRNDKGVVLTDRQLAMIVMEERLTLSAGVSKSSAW